MVHLDQMKLQIENKAGKLMHYLITNCELCTGN